MAAVEIPMVVCMLVGCQGLSRKVLVCELVSGAILSRAWCSGTEEARLLLKNHVQGHVNLSCTV